MKTKQMERIRTGKGFIAALDQSGGSTPNALKEYGVSASSYSNDEEMYVLVHEMRKRILTSAAFDSKHILGAILFENTIHRKTEGLDTADYLWENKGVVPFLKIDDGLAELRDGVQRMKPIAALDERLARARDKHIFGTKMRSVIKEANKAGIRGVVDQQFELAEQIIEAGLVPIVEPEIDIFSKDKAESEKWLLEMLQDRLTRLSPESNILLKLSIPSVDDFYFELTKNPQVVRVLALSGGYSLQEANERLARNQGLIASFSRALAEGLSAEQTPEQFDAILGRNIESIYDASVN
ncbi:fructose bisphosphate aldolase [Paenibacillus albicereus]|uniref:fructose-bisphosphate aldolase n=1 Tax=Paenibacillus albicereus TaxID=2726185 RepID=A0A6H2GY80_9BACL|nr:fructose bisphosphate aldolase [Paenibacillus albicereus]QJC52078.1 fructose bisphosphate aldolase [Paenibacillus albicereus]